MEGGVLLIRRISGTLPIWFLYATSDPTLPFHLLFATDAGSL